MASDLICIICPRGCHLHVDDELNVSGNSCPRGAKYGVDEVTAPTRTITSTVKCNSSIMAMCPVKTDKPIPKGMIFQVMEEINKVRINVPIRIGDIIIHDILGTGSDIVSTRELLE